MNPVQEAIARVTGLDGEISELRQTLGSQNDALEHLISDNALLQREIEDLDYLNLYDLNVSVTEIMGMTVKSRLATITRLRRLRQENPLAKQAVKLCLRFTLGKGIQYTIAPEKGPSEITPPLPAKPGLNGKATEAFIPGQPPVAAGGTGSPVIPGGKPAEVPPPNFHPQPEELDDQLTSIMEDFWSDPENKLVMTSYTAMKEWLDDCYTDGERFFVAFTSQAAPYVKLTDIPLDEIKEIIYSPDNHRIPVYYKRVYQPLTYSDEAGYRQSGNVSILYYLDYRISDEMLASIKGKINIGAEKLADEGQRIFHTMPNPLWTKGGQRGISELYSSREWFKVFKEFMEDRAGINAAATSIAYKRKVKGGPTAVAQFKGKLGGLPVGYDSADNQGSEIKKLTRPSSAAVYDSNPAVDLEWNKADTGAVNAKEDARLLLMAAGAGVGTSITYFGEGGDANLATAQAMELPMVKSYEDWQEWVNQVLRELTEFVIVTATSPDEAKKMMKRVAFHFPPIISQDVVKWMTAWTQVVTAVAPGNEVVHREAIRGALSVMGVQNIEGLMPLIEAEQERAQAKKEADRLDFLNNLQKPPTDPISGSSPGPNFPGKPPSRALPADVTRIAQGKPPVERNGPRPA